MKEEGKIKDWERTRNGEVEHVMRLKKKREGKERLLGVSNMKGSW